jgi:YbbR domain-containing protein
VKRIWPFRHLGLKALSVAIAVMLWMAVSGEETVERGLRVPLELQQLPGGVELTGDVPTTVDVRVRGGSGVLSRVGAGDVVAELDLRSARPGRRVFSLTQDQIRVPFGVDVVQIAPSAIAIVFEAAASRRVPVVPAVDGSPAPGFVVGPAQAEPATVEVIGPESAVSRVTEAVTEPVSVTNARVGVRETVTLGVLDPSLRLKHARSAVVTVAIVPAPMERTLRHVPVHLRHLSPGLTAQASPTNADVTLRGSREAMSRVDSDAVTAYVDLSGLGAGEYQLTVKADATREAGVTHIEPVTVQVRINGSGR